jgi:hypothetical protein
MYLILIANKTNKQKFLIQSKESRQKRTPIHNSKELEIFSVHKKDVVITQIMVCKRVLEENHIKEEKQRSKQMTCEVTKYNINSKIII